MTSNTGHLTTVDNLSLFIYVQYNDTLSFSGCSGVVVFRGAYWAGLLEQNIETAKARCLASLDVSLEKKTNSVIRGQAVFSDALSFEVSVHDAIFLTATDQVKESM